MSGNKDGKIEKFELNELSKESLEKLKDRETARIRKYRQKYMKDARVILDEVQNTFDRENDQNRWAAYIREELDTSYGSGLTKEETVFEVIDELYTKNQKKKDTVKYSLICNFESLTYDFLRGPEENQFEVAKKMYYIHRLLKLVDANPTSDYEKYEDSFCPDELIKEHFFKDKQNFLANRDNILSRMDIAYERDYKKENQALTDRIVDESNVARDAEYQNKWLQKTPQEIQEYTFDFYKDAKRDHQSGNRTALIGKELNELHNQQLAAKTKEECIDLTVDMLLKTRLYDRAYNQPFGSNEEYTKDDNNDRAILKEYVENIADKAWSINLKGLFSKDFDTIKAKASNIYQSANLSMDVPEALKIVNGQYTKAEMDYFRAGKSSVNKSISELDKVNYNYFIDNIDDNELKEKYKATTLEKINALTDLCMETDPEKAYEHAAAAIIKTRELGRIAMEGADNNDERIKYNNDEDYNTILNHFKSAYPNVSALKVLLQSNANIDNYAQELSKELNITEYNLTPDDFASLTYVPPVVEEHVETEEERAERERLEQENAEKERIEEEKRQEEERRIQEEQENLENERISAIKTEQKGATSKLKGAAKTSLNLVYNSRINAVKLSSTDEEKIKALATALNELQVIDATKQGKGAADSYKKYFGFYTDKAKEYLEANYRKDIEKLASIAADSTEFEKLATAVNESIINSYSKSPETYIANNKESYQTALSSNNEAVRNQKEVFDSKIKALANANDEDAIYSAAAELYVANSNMIFVRDDIYTKTPTDHDISIATEIAKKQLLKYADPKLKNMSVVLKDMLLDSAKRAKISRDIGNEYDNAVANARKEELSNVLRQAGLNPEDSADMLNVMCLNDRNKEYLNSKVDTAESVENYAADMNSMVGFLSLSMDRHGNSLSLTTLKTANDMVKGSKSLNKLKYTPMYHGFISQNRMVVRPKNNPDDICFINNGPNGYFLSAPLSQLRNADEETLAQNGFADKAAFEKMAGIYDNIVNAHNEFDAHIEQIKENLKGDELSRLESTLNFTADVLKTVKFNNKLEEIKPVEDNPNEINADIKPVKNNNDSVIEENPNEINIDIKPEIVQASEKANKIETDEQQREKFAKLSTQLKDAMTKVNSKEYRKIITLIDKLATGDSDLETLMSTGVAINKYLAHKSKDGVKANVFKKLAAVEKVSKYIDKKLAPYAGSDDTFDIDDQILSAGDIKLGLAAKLKSVSKKTLDAFKETYSAKQESKIEDIKKDNKTKQLGKIMKNANVCMNKIILDACENNPKNVKDFEKMRKLFADEDFAREQLNMEKKKVAEAEAESMHM